MCSWVTECWDVPDPVPVKPVPDDPLDTSDPNAIKDANFPGGDLNANSPLTTNSDLRCKLYCGTIPGADFFTRQFNKCYCKKKSKTGGYHYNKGSTSGPTRGDLVNVDFTGGDLNANSAPRNLTPRQCKQHCKGISGADIWERKGDGYCLCKKLASTTNIIYQKGTHAGSTLTI